MFNLHRYNDFEKGSQSRRGIFVFILALIFGLVILAKATPAATSLGGTSGLINIPTAEILSDGEVSFGISYIRKPYAVLGKPNYSNVAYYGTIGYLPFLEISLRVTRRTNFQEPQAIGDRAASFRVRLIKERTHIPALVFGAHDIMGVFGGTGAIHFNALYLVGSKTLVVPFSRQVVHLHFGVGTDWIKAANRQLVGAFGGFDAKLNELATVMMEYDTEKINVGARLDFLPHTKIDIVLLDMRAVSGALSFYFSL